MSNKRRLMYCALGMVLLLSCIGIYSRCQRKPVIEKVERDTVVVYDTIFHHYPKPVDSAVVRYVTKVLPVVRYDTVHHVIGVDNMKNSVNFRENSASFPQDSALVEIPITSKHYNSTEYDAWVSGYEASLDSIKVYQRTEYITETITKTINARKKPWGLGFHVGYGYDFQSKTAAPFVGVGLSYDIISF